MDIDSAAWSTLCEAQDLGGFEKFVKNDTATAALDPEHGVTELSALNASCLAPALAFKDYNKLPALRAACQKVYAFGYLKTFSGVEFTEGYLGSVVHLFSGALDVYVIPSRMLLEAIGSDGVVTSLLSRVSAFLKGLSSEKAALLKESQCLVHHGKVTSGMSLVIPPGFVVCSRVSSEEAVIGAKGQFLLNHKDAAANLRAIQKKATKERCV